MIFKIILRSLTRKQCLILCHQKYAIFPMCRKFYHTVPFINLYKEVSGQPVTDHFVDELKRKYPKIFEFSKHQIQCTLKILNKFGITAEDACFDPHIFCMNHLLMDNYAEILKECNFTIILPKHIIRYHTLVKSRTISQLKKEGLLKDDLNLEKLLLSGFFDWPKHHVKLINFLDSDTNILTIRMSVLERYLQYKFSITSDEFKNYCKNYLPLKHRPICDIQEALDIAQNVIKFNVETIRRNGFIISSDPANTRLILENVDSLGGLDIRDAIKIEPAILKNRYQALIEIKDMLQKYSISNNAQRRCLKIYCMRPDTVQERLEQLIKLKEYQVLSSNPRVLYLVVHEKKMLNRLAKIQAAKKNCYSLNHLVASNKVFNTYINSFGNKICSRDVAVLVSSSLSGAGITNKSVLNKLKRHKYWLHTALNVVGENIQMLKRMFTDDVIFDNCQILLYPVLELEQYIEYLMKIRDGEYFMKETSKIELDSSYNNLNYSVLTDSQILSLILYEMEKKYHFSGDGIWNKLDSAKIKVKR
ncbi:transcription termination factor 5, mitochondrial-like [Melitaea cinxia]|uniref:transcription termination factor 5, mitochondrial-like n=1 Tax=Melitaea cinxia TaxID=113334 RepID=UPI001E26F843|nr:transcription termination factor 5, mitochondrial-like [Melitaea cinxia]